MHYIADGRGSWRNVHVKHVDIDTLEQMLVDAFRLSEFQFTLLYGHRAYRWYAPDNSIRVASHWNIGKLVNIPLKPSVSISHKNDPRKGDQVVFENYDTETKTYGKIVWSSSDEVGIFMFKEKTTETWPADLLESVRGSTAIRWKVVL